MTSDSELINGTGAAVSGFTLNYKQFFTVIFICYFLYTFSLLEHATLHMFLHLMQYTVFSILSQCMHVLFFPPKIGLELFQFDT